MPLGEGVVFAGYRVIRLLGSGGMGEVYLVQHPRMPRHDALKILPADVSADPDFRARFEREADMAANLWHPHIVGVHDRGEFEEQLWISMDFVDGADAGRLLTDRYPAGMPENEVTEIVSAVAGALDYAHKRGLLHRDVKPANIMLTHVNDEEQRVLLTDFGIARSMDDVSGLTATNMALGTVAYSAPEQLMGEGLDGSTDQYALAATAYHLLTGLPLFPHSNPAVIISRKLTESPPRLEDTRPALKAQGVALARALSRHPGDRFQSCTAFARAFKDGAASESPSRSDPAAATTQAAPVAPKYPRAEQVSAPRPKAKATASKTSASIANTSNSVRPNAATHRSSRPWSIAVASIVVLLVAAAVVILWPRPRDQASNGVTSTPMQPTPSNTFDGMRDFVAGYYADLPANPSTAWAKLDAHCQEQTGKRQFEDFWATIQSVSVISIEPRDATSVVARLRYVRSDGQANTEDRWLKMAVANGVTLLDESGRVGAVQDPPAGPPSSSEPAAATEIVTTAAVVNGLPANGYREAYNDPDNTLNGCDTSSAAAVSDNIYLCSPFAAGADVCWPAPPTSMLCLVDHDPWDKALHRFVWNNYSLTPAAPPNQPAPFAVLLDDGTRCKYFYKALGSRDDGYYGFYSCGPLDALLAKEADDPIDRSQPLWTVKVGEVGSDTTHFPPPQTHTIVTAWFAGD